jgi:hypothetical protein
MAPAAKRRVSAESKVPYVLLATPPSVMSGVVPIPWPVITMIIVVVFVRVSPRWGTVFNSPAARFSLFKSF